MIKPVPISRARAGMWFHRLGGSGLHHAFVKNGFLLEARDIAVLAEGGVEELIIDTDKGLDVEDDGTAALAPATPETEAAEVEAAAPAEEAPASAPLPADDPPQGSDKASEMPAAVTVDAVAAPSPVVAPRVPRESMDQELHRARRICQDSKAQVVALFTDARLGRAIQPEAVMPMVEAINESVSRHPDALLSVVRLKNHDEYTYMHSVAVCALMVALARRLGLPEDQVRDAGAAGMLHDLGKAAMPLTVLNKPGALSDDEFKIMKAHPVRGYHMLVQSGSAPEAVLDVALHHHEKFDGSGYPHNLKGDAIGLMARMGAVCDVYDAITSNRPYKKAWGPAESLQRMVSWNGHFDELVLKAFIRSVGIYPVGALVRLESDRLGVVLEQGEGSLLAPKVRVFFNARKREPVFIKDIDLGAPDCGDRIVGLESADKWNFPNMERLWLSQ
ncbi:HD-GYP domain-containing protein [Silanimonas sp.]|uniref:HD-GYP domain-containing protein n=1 Tax=Silanimonas sp. TaxID=1929290 RepID=UPI0022C32414|nr:HD-GYP domain-containing protein [Silanimonas sp.]MCZ8116266.1 HD-GYP domain-containing protein [Silanimonas sp.]